MKQLSLVVLLLGALLLVTGCGDSKKEEHKEATVMTSEAMSMRPVEEVRTSGIKETTSSKSEKSAETTVETSSSDKKKEQSVDELKLVKEYGEAYANFSSINDRNEKLKKLMTKECIENNGIDVKTGVALESQGEMKAIYQNEKKEYAVLLECMQNGTKTRVLLLAKVKGNKISEMTYNSVKQEY
ncbi:hypothetical protein IHP33_04215 [Enterococcus faecalis]|uniref:EF0163 family protein n=1 Tax=Enterococcus faecalis TaxID=1351 RepID=UPI00177F0E53|nr:EF0163 family protein [Enterococcus faecalis]MBD9844921.1 hypothetical protein [Enterococcus faecalis]